MKSASKRSDATAAVPRVPDSSRSRLGYKNKKLSSNQLRQTDAHEKSETRAYFVHDSHQRYKTAIKCKPFDLTGLQRAEWAFHDAGK